MAAIERFAQNTDGRDFVIGDIHGCFDQLEAALDRVDFDPARDRAFSVGDLIDRGPHSPAAREWLERPWFHTCLGNHEEMMLLSVTDPTQQLAWLLFNGGEWWLALDTAAREQFLAAFAEVPLALEIETALGRLGVVHADVPAAMSWPDFVQALAAGDPQIRQTALWGRDRAEGFVSTPVEGIDRVVCGHTITPDRRIHVVGNVWFIDTGAFFREGDAKLTVIPITELFAEPLPGNPESAGHGGR